MIQELVELSNRLPRGSISHDALDNSPISIDCVIDHEGNFNQFIPLPEKVLTVTERIIAKKGKARLLVDKAEEVLGFGEKAEKKHQLFLDKLNSYKHVNEIKPALLFYGDNRENGIVKAMNQFPKQIEEKQRNGNIAFLCFEDSQRLHEHTNVYNAIIQEFEKTQKEIEHTRFEKCSICGSSSFPIADIPHGMIKRVPDGQSSGCALVSYNDTAYESYGLSGNENSSICTRCSRGYVDALNWLLSNGISCKNEKGKEIFIYKNRKKISDDTAIVFWLRNSLELTDLDLLDKPNEEAIRAMIDAVHSGKDSSARNVDSDIFYAITLSGSAARILVRDWIETSVENLQRNLIEWFKDIQVVKYNNATGGYSRFYDLVQSVKSKSSNDVQHGRIGTALWKCALLKGQPPLWLLASVLNRLRTEQSSKPDKGKNLSSWEYKLPERIALLKLALNRKNKKQEGVHFMATLDESNKNTAYICGRIFAVLESIQYHASGGNLNAGIRERFFSSASTTPSTAFGRLMKLTQHHLSKIRGENAGLAINLDKKMQELFSNIEGSQFPSVFSLEEQASFAIGYYHQRQKDFSTNNQKEK